jgi:GNAT superfamily N-acetyltransferase
VARTSLDPSALEIRLLAEQDLGLLPPFDCGDQDLNEFLRDDAWRLQQLHTVTTYLALYEGTLQGYVAVTLDAVKLERSDARKLKLAHDDHPVVPALKVARLACAADFRAAYRGLGEAMMGYAAAIALSFSSAAGCRLLTVDAYPDAVAFYESLGFVANKIKATPAATGATSAPPPSASTAPPRPSHPSMRFDLHAKVLPTWVPGH